MTMNDGGIPTSVILKGVVPKSIADAVREAGVTGVTVTGKGDVTTMKGSPEDLDTAVQVLVDSFGGQMTQLKRVGYGTN